MRSDTHETTAGGTRGSEYTVVHGLLSLVFHTYSTQVFLLLKTYKDDRNPLRKTGPRIYHLCYI